MRERKLESIDPSSPHFCPLSAFRDCTFVLSFFSAFVRHEQESIDDMCVLRVDAA